MAIVVIGKSTCAICQGVLQSLADVVAFAPFVVNQNDPLNVFSDAAMHRTCFELHPLAAVAAIQYETLQAKAEKRTCDACLLRIENPDEFVPFGLLTSDANDPLHQYNFAEFHKKCLKSWSGRTAVSAMLTDKLEEGLYAGPGLAWLIEKLE